LSDFKSLWDQRYEAYLQDFAGSAAASNESDLVAILNKEVNKIDVYSLGITILDIVLTYIDIREAPPPQSLSEILQGLVIAMIEPNPKQRVSPAEALRIYKSLTPIKEMFGGGSKSRTVAPTKTTTIVLVHAKWCHYCQVMKPAWQTVKRRIRADNNTSRNKNIDLIEVEEATLKTFEKKFPLIMHQVRGAVDRLTFPTIVILKPNARPKAFVGNRDPDTMYKAFTR
jgi:thiol-disulfide isomerase/thioredoxin